MRAAIMCGLVCCQALEPRRLLAGIVFPDDAGVIDVTAAPYLAIPSDGADDTAAIQAALDAHPSGNHIFYFPDGVYDLSATLRPALDDGVTKRNIFQGQSRDGTILKLPDGIDFAGAIISFRSGPAQFFRNGVRDLTLDIGSGNPRAIGLQFNASNQGAVRDVLIRSGDGAGAIGLDLKHSSEVGPTLIERVEIVGFDVGIWSGWQTASQTFEQITLRGQRQVGWVNEASQTVFARRVVSRNDVTAIRNAPFGLPGDGQGRMLLIDSDLRRLSGEGGSAIVNNKALFLRDVMTAGYARALDNQLAASRGNDDIPAGHIDEHWANGAYASRRGGPFELFESPDTTLRLPVEDPPQIPWDEPALWTGPHRFGGIANDSVDDTAAIQAAIDSGASTVYLPRGTWRVNGTLTLRGNVRRFLGTEAIIAPGAAGRLVLADGAHEAVLIERLQAGGLRLDHASSRTWVLASSFLGPYDSSVPDAGRLFISDVGLGGLVVRPGRQVWARQLNIEGNTPAGSAKIRNDGGVLWLLGYKTEDDGVQILTTGGGRTELLGALHVAGFGAGPRFVTVDASFVAALAPGPSLVEETRAGVVRSGAYGTADLYAAFDASAIAARELILDNADPEGVAATGAWTASTAFPGGFIDQDFLFAAPGSDAVAAFSTALQPGWYEVQLRWARDVGGQDHSGHASNAPVQVHHADGVASIAVDQRGYGGSWRAIGNFRFADSASVQISADGADGKVIADAVRFVRIDPPPAVQSSAYEFDAAPPRLRLEFTSDVGPSLSLDDVSILDADTSAPLPASTLTLAYDDGVATVGFVGHPLAIPPDGRYRLILSADGIRDSRGLALDGDGDGMPGDDFTYDFFVLAGDANRDRRVDVADLGILATHWQQAGRVFSDGDFTYDGVVDVADLGILATNWQAAVLPAAPALTAFAPGKPASPFARRRLIALLDG